MEPASRLVSLNGSLNQPPPERLHIRDKKPIVTYAGDTELFQSVESTLVGCLGQEGAEWGRSYGRPVRTVQVSASFVPFGKESLGVDPKLRRPLIETPVLHTFWTQCSDVETYKSTVRDDIDAWMKVLLEANISDWMIVLVETYDFRKTNKLLPRTTVLDKIRSDFGAKHADRCLSVINPLRSESRSAGSWRGLMVNFRLLLLTAYDRTLLRFEEFVREQRERRNQPGWSFTKYFLLQEELAFVLEMLGVYEEALIQYDELDALFTQFVLNSHLGESPSWLSQFCKPLESWSGLTLSDSGINVVERNRIRNDTVSLLQFRNYLFSRQCAMLLCAKKPWEVAERTLPFLHNCLRELTLLEVSAPPGTVSCWVYLSCLEVLLTCETYTERSLVEQYSIYTAGLWAYARRKLGELGELCGLMPGNAPTSEQIHLVVEISSGLDESSAATVEKLKQALSSQQAFCKQYLELSELAMGTYKHIGRMRCARSVGHDLAKFYRTIGDTQTAITFLQNALHCYEHDGWKQLSVNARLQLASSYKEIGDMHRYVKMCASIASSSELDATSRLHHFDEMVKTLKMSVQDPPWTGPLGDCLTLTDVDVRVERGSTSVSVVIGIDSLLPASVHCPAVALSIVSTTSASGQKHHGNETPSRQHPKKESSNSSPVASIKKKCKEDLVPVNPFLQRLPAFSRLDYQQDKSLAGANLDIKNQKTLLKRQDSHKYRKVSNVTRSDFSRVLSASDITLKPGRNIVTLSSKENDPGHYRLGQLSILLLGQLELLSTLTCHKLHFEVTRAAPTIALLNTTRGQHCPTNSKCCCIATATLLAGVRQALSLDVNSGGHHIARGSTLRLKTTSGLGLQLEDSDEPLKQSLEVTIGEDMPPNTTLRIPLTMLAQLPSFKEGSSIDHTVSIKTPWSDSTQEVTLSMQPALTSSVRLLTCRLSKVLHISVAVGGGTSSSTSASCIVGSCGGKGGYRGLVVGSPRMCVLSPPGAQLLQANPPDQKLVITGDTKVGFMWKLVPDANADTAPVKTEFTLHYHTINSPPPQDGDGSGEVKDSSGSEPPALVGSEQPQTKPQQPMLLYKCTFEINNYRTLYIVESRVEPVRGCEFCRVSTVCQLTLKVTRVNHRSTSTTSSSSTVSTATPLTSESSTTPAGGSSETSLMYEVLAEQNMWAVCGRTAGVLSLDAADSVTVGLDVMPLVNGYLPLPMVRLSKYIPAGPPTGANSLWAGSHPRLEPFNTGEVYHVSKGTQVHVIAAASPHDT